MKLVFLLVVTSASSVAAQVVGPVGARADSALSAAAAAGFSGVVRIDHHGTVILRKGYGMANRETRTPFTPATVVQIGSNTKDLTAVALLQLQERGRLKLSDSLAKFFPNVPADKRSITLQQIMAHRAGFPNNLGSDFEAIGRQALLDRAFARPLEFAPGTKNSYSNTGYSVLAAVIETVTGHTYDEYVNENILKPLGMRTTGLVLPHFDAALLAHGYSGSADQGTMLSRPHAADGSYWNLRGNGGLLSTVDDMHLLYHALFETDELLPRHARAERFPVDEPIGLAGSDGVCEFLYSRIPARGTEIIIATNNAAWTERRVRDAIAPIFGLRTSAQAGAAAGGAAPATAVHPPSGAVAAMLTTLIASINSGDSAQVSSFIVEHFVSDSSSPPLAAKVQRMLTMHANLGMLTILTLEQPRVGVVEMALRSATEGRATIKVQLDPMNPTRIRGLQISVGD